MYERRKKESYHRVDRGYTERIYILKRGTVGNHISDMQIAQTFVEIMRVKKWILVEQMRNYKKRKKVAPKQRERKLVIMQSKYA